MTLSAKLKIVRCKSLLSQADLTVTLDVSLFTVNRCENGKSISNHQTMTKIKSFCQERQILFDISDELSGGKRNGI